jgi:membrane associated rhomboid family serine protease
MEIANAPATYALIVVNLIVSIYALATDNDFMDSFVFRVRDVVMRKQTYRVVTSCFLHANGPHLLLNMMTLFFFGPVVEQTLGKLGFLVVYFGSIITSGILSAYLNRRNPDYSSVGASDAVSGVTLSFCLFYPLAPIYFLGLPFGIPAVLYGAAFVLLSARLMNNENRIIAHEGHLGGALGGLVLTLLMRPDALTRFF